MRKIELPTEAEKQTIKRALKICRVSFVIGLVGALATVAVIYFGAVPNSREHSLFTATILLSFCAISTVALMRGLDILFERWVVSKTCEIQQKKRE